MRTVIRLSPTAISQIEYILNDGKRAQVKVVTEKRKKRLLVQEVSTANKYDVVIQSFHD